jgi:GAF domain-containing protein
LDSASPLKDLAEVVNTLSRLTQTDEHDREILTGLLMTAILITKADAGNIQILEGNDLKIKVQIGFDKPFLDYFAIVNDARSACGAAKNAGQRIIVPDVTRSEIFADPPTLQVMIEAGVRGVQSTPLIGKSGSILGVVSTHYRQVFQITEQECRLLDIVARLAIPFISG